MSTPKAAIFGCAGPDLSADERAFFRDADPLGFILFARNVDTPERTRRLVDDLRSSVARAEAPVLIDQEGGRVARLRPPHSRKAPPARLLGERYARDPVDSHHLLPRVTASRELLERTDFLPFRLLSDLPWAMTGHLLFEAVDPEAAITLSARGIEEVIRGHIGFDGLLLSDDLSMQALGGSLGDRANRALAAGCDAALHCNGKIAEMADIAGRTGPLSAAAGRRFDAGRSFLARHRAPARKAGLADAARRPAAPVPA